MTDLNAPHAPVRGPLAIDPDTTAVLDALDSACTHRHQTDRMSSHRDLVAADAAGEPTASRSVCWRRACRDRAAEAIHRATGIFPPVLVVGGGRCASPDAMNMGLLTSLAERGVNPGAVMTDYPGGKPPVTPAPLPEAS